MGVGIVGIAADSFFKLPGRRFELALLQEHATQFEIGAGRCLFEVRSLGKDAGGLRQTTLAKQKRSEIDPGVLRASWSQRDRPAQVPLGLRVAAKGEIIQARGTMNASRGRSRQRKVKGFTSRFVLRHRVAVAGQIVTAVNRWLLQRARAEERRLSFGQTVAGNAR